jgi:hypothetical protein
MMSFEGSGDMQTGDPSQWQSNVLVSNPDPPLEQRWISIPVRPRFSHHDKYLP